METLRCDDCQKIFPVKNMNRHKNIYLDANNLCTRCASKRTKKKYRDTHKEKAHKYYETNKDVILNKQKEYYAKNKDRRIKYVTEYRKRNWDIVKAKIKAYTEKNKERISTQRRKHYSDNIEQMRKRNIKYALQNKEKINIKKKEYTSRTKDKKREYDKIYREKNKNKKQENGREYYKRNKNSILEKSSVYIKHKRQTDVHFRIMTNLRNRVFCAIKQRYGVTKSKSTLELLGCSILEAREHIERQFTDGMTWDNYGLRGWHIDHIKPCSSFDLTDPAQQKKCFHFSNLQPLWWRDNLSKGAKILPDAKERGII